MAVDQPMSKRVIEVTSKMVHIPSGPAPRQVLTVVIKLLIRYNFCCTSYFHANAF